MDNNEIAERDELAEEAILVERAKTDAEAFGQLYEKYVDQIYNYIFYRTTNHYDAEDLTAKVFFNALKNIENYQHRGVPFSAWLYRIAHNLTANWHRDRSRRKVIALDELALVSQRPQPEHLTELNNEKEHLLNAVQDLPADRQQLLILKFGEDLSNARIGKIMGRTEGAIKSLYHRTLRALRKDLQEEKE